MRASANRFTACTPKHTLLHARPRVTSQARRDWHWWAARLREARHLLPQYLRLDVHLQHHGHVPRSSQYESAGLRVVTTLRFIFFILWWNYINLLQTNNKISKGGSGGSGRNRGQSHLKAALRGYCLGFSLPVSAIPIFSNPQTNLNQKLTILSKFCALVHHTMII